MYEFNNIADKLEYVVNDKLKKTSKLKQRVLTISQSAGREARNLSKICGENKVLLRSDKKNSYFT